MEFAQRGDAVARAMKAALIAFLLRRIGQSEL